MTRSTPAPRPLATRLFGTLLGILVVLLPALVAASGLDRRSSASEQARLSEAIALLDEPTRDASVAARTIYGVTLPEAPAQALQANREATIARARIAMLGCGFVVSALLYLLVAATRGGLTALMTCVTFAGLPAVVDDGHALRPEPLATAFGLLGTILLVTLTLASLSRRARRQGARHLPLVLGMIVLSGAAYGLALVTQPRLGVLLLVPGGLVTLACALQTWTWVRLYRRRRFTKRVLPALAQRSWPWFLLGVVGMGVTSAVIFLLLGHGVIAPDATGSSYTLLPESGLRRFLLGTLMLLGGVRLVLEGGHQLSARRRLYPSLATLLFIAVVLMQYGLSGAGLDTTLPACGVAILAGEGAMTALMLVVGMLVVRAQRRR
jgi:hypothetical protein